MYKFCILSAGKGTRNNSIQGLHKSLLPIENKSVISHIIDKVPENIEIVIAVGYKSNQIKSYLKLTHSNRRITFVDVDNYDGEGSGPGYSLLCCEKYLQSPFIFTSSDTLVESDYGGCEHNWIGISEIDVKDSSSYCLIEGDEELNKLYYGNGDKAFIGMAGIYDYSTFWNNLRIKDLIKNEHQVLNGFNNLSHIKLRYFKWHDTGNVESYLKTRNVYCNDIVANKNDESIFIEGDYVIKYFSDSKKMEEKIDRIKYLNGTSPECFKLDDNMYYYNYINGNILSNIFNERILKKILPFLKDKFGNVTYIKNDRFLNNCKYMYRDKTYERCKYFINKDIDNIKYINGVKVDKINNMLDKIDWNSIYEKSIPTRFHGDFQCENIIYDEDKFILIDWRQSFGDSLEIGDFYYDLTKFYHSLLVNGNDVKNKLYKVEIKNNEANISNHMRSNLMFLLNELKRFCIDNNLSWVNIELLGVLQYLGISSLYNDFHEGEYGKFLFLYGKYLLSKLYDKNAI